MRALKPIRTLTVGLGLFFALTAHAAESLLVFAGAATVPPTSSDH